MPINYLIRRHVLLGDRIEPWLFFRLLSVVPPSPLLARRRQRRRRSLFSRCRSSCVSFLFGGNSWGSGGGGGQGRVFFVQGEDEFVVPFASPVLRSATLAGKLLLRNEPDLAVGVVFL